MLKVSDFPRSEYDGYFEVYDAHGVLEDQIAALKGEDPDTLRAKADLLEKLGNTKQGHAGVRIYGKADPTGVKGDAKEYSNVVVAEFEGDPYAAETFVRAEMAKLKKG